MLKEIFEQPKALQACMSGRLERAGGARRDLDLQQAADAVSPGDPDGAGDDVDRPVPNQKCHGGMTVVEPGPEREVLRGTIVTGD